MAITFKAILGISRAPFLLLPVLLVGVGAAASALDTTISWGATLLALIGLISLHIGVNALNEAGDMATGIDLNTERTPFSGGSGTLPEGRATIRFTRNYGLATTGLGLLIGLWFLIDVGWLLLPFLAFGAFAVLTYTNILARIGLGEIVAGLGLGAVPILGASLVQDGDIGRSAIAASIPAFFMTFNLLLLNEFPDAEADRAGGRRHLVIMLGRARAAKVYVTATLAAPGAIIFAVLFQALPLLAFIACLPTLLLIPTLGWALKRPEEKAPLTGQAQNVIWNLATNLLMMIALIAAARSAPLEG